MRKEMLGFFVFFLPDIRTEERDGKGRAAKPLWQLANGVLDWTQSLILPLALGRCHSKCSWTGQTIMARPLQRGGQLLCGWTCACECLGEKALARFCSGNPAPSWLYGLWLQSIISRSNWLQLLSAGPIRAPCKQRNSGVITAYFQRGILQISSYRVALLRASSQAIVVLEDCPVGAGSWSRWSLVFVSGLESFPAVAWLRPSSPDIQCG